MSKNGMIVENQINKIEKNWKKKSLESTKLVTFFQTFSRTYLSKLLSNIFTWGITLPAGNTSYLMYFLNNCFKPLFQIWKLQTWIFFNWDKFLLSSWKSSSPMVYVKLWIAKKLTNPVFPLPLILEFVVQMSTYGY